jgi:CBS-domain-containing membrane protein
MESYGATVTTVNATQEYLQLQINQKDQRIQELEQHSQRVTQRDFNTAAELNALREDLKAFTLHELKNNDITDEQAEKLAVIGNFELTKEFSVSLTVSYDVVIKAKDEEAVQEIIDSIDFDQISYSADGIESVNWQIDDSSIDEY